MAVAFVEDPYDGVKRYDIDVETIIDGGRDPVLMWTDDGKCYVVPWSRVYHFTMTVEEATRLS